MMAIVVRFFRSGHVAGGICLHLSTINGEAEGDGRSYLWSQETLPSLPWLPREKHNAAGLRIFGGLVTALQPLPFPHP